MNVLVAPDSLKGSLTAKEASHIITTAGKIALPNAVFRPMYISDGGESAIDLLEDLDLGRRVTAQTMDPSGRMIDASYLRLHNSHTAWIELSQASGLHLLRNASKDPGRMNTFGTGVLIRHALTSGAKHIIIGMGGSATNDGGAGILNSMGFQLLDSSGTSVPSLGNLLSKIAHIQSPTRQIHKMATFELALDVTNPLYGPEGAAFVFAAQKGASPTQIVELDLALQNWGALLEKYCGRDVSSIPGAGAAGGAAAGLMGALGAEPRSGFDLIADMINLDDHLAWADIVITAEGSLDDQSLNGKATVELAKRARDLGVPVVAFVGNLTGEMTPFKKNGIVAAKQIRPAEMDIEESMIKAASLLESTVIATLKDMAWN